MTNQYLKELDFALREIEQCNHTSLYIQCQVYQCNLLLKRAVINNPLMDKNEFSRYKSRILCFQVKAIDVLVPRIKKNFISPETPLMPVGKHDKQENDRVEEESERVRENRWKSQDIDQVQY